jgi:hypothetical protein
MKLILNLIFLVNLFGCGTKNLFECDGGYAKSKCSPRTKDEDARIALDREDYDTAITLLNELIAAEPETYQRYPLLSAAYAARSGFDIFNIVTANFGGNSSLLQTMSSFLPTPVTKGSLYDASLSDMSSGVSTLLTIPPDQRLATSADKYATSAVLQLTLYQAAYGVMLLNKFTYSASGYDPSLLANMTATDAANILAAIAGAASASGSGAGSAASAAVAAIAAQPGATDQERLAAWSQAAR